MTFTSFLFGVFSAGLSVGVIVAVGGLLAVQLKIILKNETSIEDWIVTKAEARERTEAEGPFIYPYNLGWFENFRLVFLKPLSSGLWWPVVDGCDQFTLTVEQLKQKDVKKLRTRLYQAIKVYNGSWCPLFAYGVRTCLGFPCSDESRIALQIGDNVAVTRWKKWWLYGQVQSKIQVNGSAPDESDSGRGWFPRHAVVVMSRPMDDQTILNTVTGDRYSSQKVKSN